MDAPPAQNLIMTALGGHSPPSCDTQQKQKLWGFVLYHFGDLDFSVALQTLGLSESCLL